VGSFWGVPGARRVNYELSALKKTVTRAQTRLQDADRRETEYLATAHKYAQLYEAACRDLGIAGGLAADAVLAALADALRLRAATLPALFDEVTAALSGASVADAVALYREFLAFILADAPVDVRAELALPALSFMLGHGNSSVHHLRTGEAVAPVAASDAKGDVGPAGAEDDAGGIDWGQDLVEANAGGDAGGGIDWGASEDSPAVVSVGGGEDAGAIDWGEDPAPDQGAGEIDWGVESSDPVGLAGSSRGASQNLTSILADPDTRAEVVNDLLELEAFLRQRHTEARGEGVAALAGLFDTAGPAVKAQTPARLAAFLGGVELARTLLTSKTAQQLFLLAASPRYVERLATSLHQKAEMSRRMHARIAELGCGAAACLCL
jgi:hypothetical protein